MFNGLKGAAIVLATMLAQSPAAAAIVTKSFAITATGFNGGPPATAFAGSFTFTFDTSILGTDQLGAVVVNSANLPYQAPFELNYFGGDTITINSANYMPNQTEVTGFALAIRNVTSQNPMFSSMNYYTVGVGGGSTRTGTLNPVVVVPGVPEPASWALLLLGFGSVGAVLRAQKRRAATGHDKACASA